MDLGAGSGAAFGRQNVAAHPRDHQIAIELVLRAKQKKLRAEGIGGASAGSTQSDPNDRVHHLIEASLDVYYAQVLLDVSVRSHQTARRWDTWAFFRRSTEKLSSQAGL
jgi:hypothetical protein